MENENKDKSIINLKIDKKLKNKFKSKLDLKGKKMQKRIVELIEKDIGENK